MNFINSYDLNYNIYHNENGKLTRSHQYHCVAKSCVFTCLCLGALDIITLMSIPFQRLVLGLPEGIFLVTDRMVTNSSADEGCMPTVLSNCALVAPHLSATAMP